MISYTYERHRDGRCLEVRVDETADPEMRPARRFTGIAYPDEDSAIAGVAALNNPARAFPPGQPRISPRTGKPVRAYQRTGRRRLRVLPGART